MTLTEVITLLKLAVNIYHEQSKRSRDAGAPLAACVMVGATLEAVLISVTNLLYDAAIKTGEAPKNGKKIKRLSDWTFFELLKVAKAAEWLPNELRREPSLDRFNVRTVPTDTIREVRNLIHPARYWKERGGHQYTDQEVHTLYVACHTAYTHLIDELRLRYPHLPTFRSE